MGFSDGICSGIELSFDEGAIVVGDSMEGSVLLFSSFSVEGDAADAAFEAEIIAASFSDVAEACCLSLVDFRLKRVGCFHCF